MATSFHPRKRAKLPQVLYLLCLATLVSTHKHGSPLHFSSLAHASSNVVLILSAERSVSVPRRLFSPLLARIHEFERVLRLGVQNLERTVGIVYRGIYPTLLSTPQPLLIYLLNNTTSLLLLGSSLLSLVRSICLSFHLLPLSPTRSRVTFVADGPLLFRRRRRRRRFAFRMEGGGTSVDPGGRTRGWGSPITGNEKYSQVLWELSRCAFESFLPWRWIRLRFLSFSIRWNFDILGNLISLEHLLEFTRVLISLGSRVVKFRRSFVDIDKMAGRSGGIVIIHVFIVFLSRLRKM